MASTTSSKLLVYVHGFRSSGANSTKATQLRSYFASKRAGEYELVCPELPISPIQAIDTVEALVKQGLQHNQSITLIGSSLGGFYSTLVVERSVNRGAKDIKAALLNPAIFPVRDLTPYVDVPQTMYHDKDKPFLFTSQHRNELAGFEQELAAYEKAQLKGDYLLIACTGDEVIDYKEMVARYKLKTIKVVEGGDHGMSDFESYIPWIDNYIFN